MWNPVSKCRKDLRSLEETFLYLHKMELVKVLAERTKLSRDECQKVLEALVETVKEEVVAGETVRLANFGVFKSVHRAERGGRNPKTGETMRIPAHKEPVFKPFPQFKEATL